jgi:hypothetical protein
MAEYDHGIKIIASSTTLESGCVAGMKCKRLQTLESTLPATTELLADRAFRATRGRERFVLYFEFYTYWDRNAPCDILAKAGLLSQREHLSTVCPVFILLPRGYRSLGGEFRLQASRRPTQQLWFQEDCLWKVEPEAWWEDVLGLMALYPLCRHGKAPREAIRYAATVIDDKATQESERAGQLFLLSVFGGLAFPRLDVAGIIGREKMRESKFAREMRQEGKSWAIGGTC